MINSDYPQPTHPRRTAEDQAREPPSFPKPSKGIASPCMVLGLMRVFDEKEGKSRKIKNILVKRHSWESDSDDDSSSSSSSSSCVDVEGDVKMKPGMQQQQNVSDTDQRNEKGTKEKAYWLRRTKAHTLLGKIKIATILERHDCDAASSTEAASSPSGVKWKITNEKCAIKCMRMKATRKQNVSENPITEVLAMHFVKQWSNKCNNSGGGDAMDAHVIFPSDVLNDEKNFYIIMPYGDDDLCNRLHEKAKFDENEARFWMDQLLTGLETLQRAGVCHRDISLENLVICGDTLLIIDMGLSVRIPFDKDDNKDDSTMDVGNNDYAQRPSHDCIRQRRYLINSQNPCGKVHYMSPEIYHRSPFDGYAVDLWAAGVVLFNMLTGSHPWDRPSTEFIRFRQITSGHLEQNLEERRLGPLSPDVVNLLQNMLQADPRKRLCLEQVRAHRWMKQDITKVLQTTSDPRLFSSEHP